MARCTAIKANGERCRGVAIEGSEWCYQHDPARSEERRRNASRGGKSGGRGRGGSGEAAEIRALLKDLTSGVLEHRVNTGVAAVVTQLANARIRLVEVERKLLETQELEERLAALEEAAGERQSSQKGGQRWGA
jgi:hypothetical protein